MDPAFAVPDFGPALPEIVLAVGALILVLVGAFQGDRSGRIVNGGALALLAVAFVAVLLQPGERVVTFNGAFVVDGFAKFMKALILLASAAGIVISLDYLRREGIDRFEYAILIVLCTLGMLVVISANDLIALYLGLELLSLSSYVIAAFHRDSLRSTEAGLKYFVLGALSSGMLLYGSSLVYGFAGTVSFPALAADAPGRARDRRRHRPRLRRRRHRLQDLGRALPHVDAGRLRGLADPRHRLLRRRAQDRRHGHGRARLRRRLSRASRDPGSRSSSSSPSPPWRSAPSPRSARPTSSA